MLRLHPREGVQGDVGRRLAGDATPLLVGSIAFYADHNIMSPLPKVRLLPGDFAVLTLTEPWATLVVLGEKEWETRSWPTSYRGPLLIQAAKTMPPYAQQACMYDPFTTVLARHHVKLPNARPEDLGGARTQRLFGFDFGSIIGAVDLADTARTEKVAGALNTIHSDRAFCELEFGDYTIGRWAFRFARPRRFASPIPVRGSLGIWTLDSKSDTAEQVRSQLVQVAA
jgi:hypothetical protein